jgi:amino acid transporter
MATPRPRHDRTREEIIDQDMRDLHRLGYAQQLVSRIHPQWRTPVWSIVITSALAVLLTVYAALYSVVVAMSTTALYLAYAFPIYLNLRNKLRRRGEYTTAEVAPWSLGCWGVPLNLIAVAWVGFITVLFSIPPNELAGWSIVLLLVFMGVYWLLDARHRFRGPRPSSEAELRRIEAELKKI